MPLPPHTAELTFSTSYAEAHRGDWTRLNDPTYIKAPSLVRINHRLPLPADARMPYAIPSATRFETAYARSFAGAWAPPPEFGPIFAAV